MAYQYNDLLKRGFIKLKLSKKHHNELFPKRKRTWKDKYEYYYNEDQLIIHKFYSWKVVIILTLLFPVSCLLYGLANFKEVFVDHCKLYQQKKYGQFVVDHVWKSDERHKKIAKLNKII